MRLFQSIKCNFLVIAVGRNVVISGACVLGLSHCFREGTPLLDNLLLLLQVLLGHLVKVETVDLRVMGRRALLEGVDGGGVKAVLDEAQRGGPE
jgi:hypothetical protein